MSYFERVKQLFTGTPAFKPGVEKLLLDAMHYTLQDIPAEFAEQRENVLAEGTSKAGAPHVVTLTKRNPIYSRDNELPGCFDIEISVTHNTQEPVMAVEEHSHGFTLTFAFNEVWDDATRSQGPERSNHLEKALVKMIHHIADEGNMRWTMERVPAQGYFGLTTEKVNGSHRVKMFYHCDDHDTLIRALGRMRKSCEALVDDQAPATEIYPQSLAEQTREEMHRGRHG